MELLRDLPGHDVCIDGFGNAGHELKTPLTIIDADAELLEMDVPGNEWLTDIRCQTRRLSDLTHDLIFLSRMEEQISSRRIEFPLSDAVSECAASFQAVAKTQDKTFITSIEPMISFVGDENGILRLLSILLDNAIKYSSDGGTISLSLACQGKKVRMTVENSLDGMVPGTLENMFERFYRGDVSRSRQEGHGIGLAIAKAVVEAHRGKISAAVKEGKTMTVSVILPLQA